MAVNQADGNQTADLNEVSHPRLLVGPHSYNRIELYWTIFSTVVG